MPEEPVLNTDASETRVAGILDRLESFFTVLMSKANEQKSEPVINVSAPVDTVAVKNAIAEKENVIRNMESEHAAVVNTLKSEIAAKDEQIALLNTSLETSALKLKEFEDAAKENEFKAFCNTLEPGLTHTEEDVAKLREAFNNDAKGLMLSILSTRGKGFVTEDTGVDQIVTNTSPKVSKVGDFDQMKQEWI